MTRPARPRAHPRRRRRPRAREVLRYPDVARRDRRRARPGRRPAGPHATPALSALNAHAYGDPRVHVVTADAFGWLRAAARGAVRRGHLGPARPRHHARAPSCTRRSSTAWRAAAWPPTAGSRSTRARRRRPGTLLDGRRDDAGRRAAHRALPAGGRDCRLRGRARPQSGGAAAAPPTGASSWPRAAGPGCASPRTRPTAHAVPGGPAAVAGGRLGLPGERTRAVHTDAAAGGRLTGAAPRVPGGRAVPGVPGVRAVPGVPGVRGVPGAGVFRGFRGSGRSGADAGQVPGQLPRQVPGRVPGPGSGRCPRRAA